jgi:hypothetical protein
MKKVTLNKSVLASAMLLAAGYMGSVEAHCLAGQTITQTGTTNAIQQDVYMVSCPATTSYLEGKLSLQSGSAVTYQIGKGGFTAGSTSDASTTAGLSCVNNGTSEAISPAAGNSPTFSVTGGPGIYSLVASKNSTTASNYAIEFHCKTAANVELIGTTQATGTFEQGGPAVGTGKTDALDAVPNSSVLANDTNTDINLVINH